MAPFSASWANICRKANGEELIRVNNDVVTLQRAEYLEQHPDEALTEHFGRLMQDEPFELMLLPAEIRAMIIQKLIEHRTVRVFLPGLYGPRPTPIPLPVTSRAGDKRLRKETILETTLNTEFEIHSGPGNAKLQKWLGDLDFKDISKNVENGFDAVKALKFPYFSRFPHHLPHITTNNDIELMLKCPRLASVDLNWVAQEVGIFGSTNDKPVHQLRREYHLDRMLALKELKNLKFSGYFHNTPSFAQLNENEGIWGLAVWFKKEFKNRGKEVIIVLPDDSKI